MAGRRARHRVPARRGARIAALGLIAGLAAGCGADAVPPVPRELRRLEQREAGCASCHGGSVAPLEPGVTATPSDHPAVGALRRILGG